MDEYFTRLLRFPSWKLINMLQNRICNKTLVLAAIIKKGVGFTHFCKTEFTIFAIYFLADAPGVELHLYVVKTL